MLTRRQFILHSGAIGASLIASPVVMGNSLTAEASGYRALVCINLAGGNDSFNMLIPSDAGQYAAYQNARGNLALGRSNLIDLSGQSATGRAYSVHSGMPELRELYDNGEAAFVANVGALDKPLSGTELQSNIDFGPERLLSHAGQIDHWQTCSSQPQPTSGWGGRTADLLQHILPSNGVPICISMSGDNIFQLGANTLPYSCESKNIHSLSSQRPVGIDFDFVTGQLARTAYRNLHGASSNWPVIDIDIDAKNGSTEPHKSAELQSQFAGDNFSQQLLKVAQIIAEQDRVKSTRQIFYVSFSGWDHHHQLLPNQAMMLPALSQGLSSFRNALTELGLFENVTTFTASEFGRSLASNGSGSDHGWGGHQLIMGGGIHGGRVYGHYPELSSLNPLNIGYGVYAPTTSNDEYFAELALWLGVPLSKIGYVLPNLQAFNSRKKNVTKLGFFRNVF